jgi:hypothetical protein
MPEKSRAGAILRGGCRRGKEWEASGARPVDQADPIIWGTWTSRWPATYRLESKRNQCWFSPVNLGTSTLRLRKFAIARFPIETVCQPRAGLESVRGKPTTSRGRRLSRRHFKDARSKLRPRNPPIRR